MCRNLYNTWSRCP